MTSSKKRAGGRTVLLSSHILSEAEALADRVTIIRAGRTVETGTLAELRHLSRTSVAAETERPLNAATVTGLAGVHDAEVERIPVSAGGTGGTQLRCEVDNAALDRLLRVLTDVGLRSLTCRPPTLEELFLRQYGEPSRLPACGRRPGSARC